MLSWLLVVVEGSFGIVEEGRRRTARKEGRHPLKPSPSPI
jgi:hypothetical protein